MKTLTLLRHAKSGWDDPVARDFDRAINPRGIRAATAIGHYLRNNAICFDHVLASPAVRVMETIDHVVSGYGRALNPEWERRIYLASAATLLDLVNALPDNVGHVLLVGHNPGLEDLVLMLAPDEDVSGLRHEVEIKFPTASLASLEFDGADWATLPDQASRFVRFVRPRDLDASLGPDTD